MASRELNILVRAKGALEAARGIGQVDKSVGGLQKKAGLGLKGLATGLGALGAAVGGASLISKSISAASDLSETISKTGVVFGAASAEVMAWGKTSATAIGLSQNAALGAAATYGNLFVSMGLAADKSADMSMKLVDLAGDLASFNNIDPTEAAEKLRAGLTGESEPLKSLGININETIIKAKALELGLVKTSASTADLKLKTVAMNSAQKEAAEATKKYGANSSQALKATVKAEKATEALEKATNKIPTTLDAATKAQAAYALIFEQSTTAQGDFARTSDGLANQQRILRAQLTNVGATLGTALLPKVSAVVKSFNTLISANMPAIEGFASKLPMVFDHLAGLVTGLPWDSMGSAFTLMGKGADAALSVFTSMPPWVQTAVLTGWGLNKLSGGLVGNLASGLIKGVLGMNAGVVNINAATVNGAGGLGGAAGTAAGIGGAAAAGWVGAAVAASVLATQDLLSRTTQQQRLDNGGLRAFNYRPGGVLSNQRPGGPGAWSTTRGPNFGHNRGDARAVTGAQEAAVLARATAAGLKPTADQITRTALATQGREDARNARLIEAALAQVRASERGSAAIVAAVHGIKLTVSARDVSNANIRRGRTVKPSGPRKAVHAPGAGP